MRKHCTHFHVVIIIAAILHWPVFSSHNEMKQATLRTIAISLRQLQSAVKNTNDKIHTATTDLNYLYNLSDIEGFIIDADSNDVILFGTKGNAGFESLLDDFATALRTVLTSDTVPVCLIAPSVEETESYEELMKSFYSGSLSVERDFFRWKKQSFEWPILLSGISPHSHFAKVMAETDCLLKNIVNGERKIKIKKLTSFSKMVLYEKKIHFNNTGSIIEGDEFNNFWLYPDTTEIVLSENVCLLKKGLTLTTNMMTNNDPIINKYFSNFKESPFALKYTEQWNNEFDQIKKAEPLFQHSVVLYKLLSVIYILNKQNLLRFFKFDSQFWQNIWKEESVHVPEKFESIHDYQYADGPSQRQRTRTGMVWFQYYFLTAIGGICLDYKELPIIQSENHYCTMLKSAILKSRPDSKSVYWEYDKNNQK